MIFQMLVVGPLEVNCYILGCERTNQAIVIDPGGDVDVILSYLERHNLELRYILNTHGHFDHVAGNYDLKMATGAKLIIHAEDVPLITSISTTAMMFGIHVKDSPPPDITINEGDMIYVGEEITLKTLHTPGHSRGSCSFILEGYNAVFVGDTLFAGSIGRTDLPGGDYNTLINSVRTKLFILPDDTRVFPGHGPETTIGYEKRFNPFF